MAENESTAVNEETKSNDASVENLKVLENIEVKLTGASMLSTELKIKDLLKFK